jgi:ABC-2 type transport system permease protein
VKTTDPHLFDLQEIRGPSALGGGLRRFFDLLWLQSITEFRLRYHGTALGFIWSLVRPLLLFAVLLAVFTQVFRLGSQVENYAPLLLFNIMLFNFFAEATAGAVTSVVDSENLVRKMQFPRLVIPLSVVITNAMQLGLNIVVVFVFMLAYGVEPGWTWLLMPVIIGALLVLTTAMAMLLSALYVRVRDVAILWAVLSTILFYATPVLYPIEFAPQEFQDVIALNPLSPLFEQAREWVIDPNAPGPGEIADGRFLLVAVPSLLFVVICAVGIWFFNREAPRIAEAL